MCRVLRLHGTPSSTQSGECLWGDLRRGSVTSESNFELRRDLSQKFKKALESARLGDGGRTGCRLESDSRPIILKSARCILT